MATCEERFEIYEAKRFGQVTWEAFTDMNEKQMVDVIQHLSEEQRECFMAAVATQEEERKVRWAAKTNAEKELLELVCNNELTQETLAKYMKETEADLNNHDEERWSILMWSAVCDNVKVMRVLIEANVDVDVQSNDGFTALHYAARHGHNDCVALLIDAHADLELRGAKGIAALQDSVWQNSDSRTALLLDAKADAWAEDNRGETSMSAALWRYIDDKKIMDEFLQQSPNEHGVTALMVAASQGDYEAIPRLLELGEDPELTDKNGMTALMMAMMPREEEEDWRAEFKAHIINLLRGDRTNAELNEMRRVLYFPKEVPPLLNLPE